MDRIEISNFKALNFSLFIGGMVNNQPIILFTNLKERKTRILPAVVKGQAEIQSMDLDTIQLLVVLLLLTGAGAKNRLKKQTGKASYYGRDSRDERGSKKRDSGDDGKNSYGGRSKW